MALLSMMRNYGATSTTSQQASSSATTSAVTFDREIADATPRRGETAITDLEEKNTMGKMQQEDDNDHHLHRGGKRSKTGFMIIPAAYSFLLMSVVMAMSVSVLIQPIQANPTCILNCAQCVKIYGDFFDGHSCAKVCMDSRSNKFDSFVDCADPTTIARFLKTF